MIEVEIPKNILKHKTKFIGNFSMRETICGGLGVIVGVLCYLMVFSGFGTTLRTILSVVVVLPFFLVGFLRPYDEPFEKIFPVMLIDNFLYPHIRTYQTKFSEPADAPIKEVKPSKKYKGVK